MPSADSYVSPRWYPSKAEHGKVVPTWNYELIHVHGTIEIHDDFDWKLKIVEGTATQQHSWTLRLWADKAALYAGL